MILSDLEFSEIKTKQASSILKGFGLSGRTLLIDVDPKNTAFLSIRNLSNAKLKSVQECSPLDIFESDNLLITKAAAELYQQRYS